MGIKKGFAPVIDGLLWEKLDLTAGETTVYTGSGYIACIYVNVINDVVTVKDGSSDMFVIPSTASGGTVFNFCNAEFTTSLVITPDTSAGSVTVVYQPYRDQ